MKHANKNIASLLTPGFVRVFIYPIQSLIKQILSQVVDNVGNLNFDPIIA